MKSLAALAFVLAGVVQLQAQNGRTEIRLSSFNDSWGGGCTPVYDDLRTYGFHLGYYKQNHFKIESRFSLLTNRFAADSAERKSLDELTLTASVPILRLDKEKDDFLWLKLGALARGSIMGASIQKAAHEIFGVNQPNLPYYNDEGIHLALGYSTSKTILDKPFGAVRSVQLKLNHSLEYILKYVGNTSLGIDLSLKKDEWSSVSLSTHYIFSKSYLQNDLVSNVSEAESGLNFNFKVNGRNIFYYLEVFPTRGFSYGGIGIRIIKPEETEPAQKHNIEVQTSVLNNGYGYNFKYAFLQTEVLNRRLQVIVNHNFHSLLKRYIPKSPEINGHGNQITAGAEIRLLKSKKISRIIEPYVNLSVGDKMISIYSKTLAIDKSVSHHFALNNDAGVDVKIPITLKYKFIDFNFSLYHRLLMLTSLTPGNESTFVNVHNSPYDRFHSFLGGGIKFKI